MTASKSRLLVGLVLVAALLPSAWIAMRFRAMPQLGAYHDDSIYLGSAKALAEGRGYRVLSVPGQPFQTKYPPLFPLLLSIVWRFNPNFPDNLVSITALLWGLLPVYLFLLYRLLRQLDLSRIAAAALCAATAISPHIILTGLMTMSEITFSIFAIAAILLLERGSPDSASENGVRLAAFAGVAAGLAFLTRTQGIALLASGFLVLAWKREWRRAAMFAAVSLAFAVPWLVWTRLHAYMGTDPVILYYVDYVRFYLADVRWTDLPEFLQTNVDSMLTGAARLMFANIGLDTLSRMFAWTVAIGSGAGMFRLARQTGRYQLVVYSLFSFVLLLPWPWPPNERFLIPIWPAVAAGIYFELHHLWGMCRTNLRRGRAERGTALAGMAAVACMCAIIAYNNISGATVDLPAVLRQNEKILDERKPGYAWLRDHTPADAHVLTYDEPLMYLYSGRTGLAMPIVHWLTYGANAARTEAYLRTATPFMKEHGLDFALETSGDFRRDLNEDGRTILHGFLSSSTDFETAFASPGASVYRVKDSGGAPISSPDFPGEWWASVRRSTPPAH